MMEQAKTMKADAIIAMRYDATEFAPGITEVLAYGTAVKLAGADAVQLRTAQQPPLLPKDPPTGDTQSRL
jgi:hypothetical protein